MNRKLRVDVVVEIASVVVELSDDVAVVTLLTLAWYRQLRRPWAVKIIVIYRALAKWGLVSLLLAYLFYCHQKIP